MLEMHAQNKVRLCALLFCITCAVTLNSQSLQWGVYAGPAYSSYHYGSRVYSANQPDLAANTLRKQGFLAGIDLRWIPVGKFGLTGGFQYTEKGALVSQGFPDGSHSAVHYLHYLCVPLYADIALNKKLSIQIGAEPSVLVRQNLRPAEADISPAGFDFPVFSRMDLCIGGGLEWRLGRRFFFRGRGVYGLIPTNDLEAPDETGTSRILVHRYNSSLFFSMGYRFGVAKMPNR